MSGAAAGKKGDRRKLDELSHVYFSAPAKEEAGPSALVPVRNLAGREGAALLERIRTSLGERGLSSSSTNLVGGKFRLDDDPGQLFTPKQFLQKVSSEKSDSFLFLQVDEGASPFSRRVIGSGDTALLLVSGEISSLKEAYLFLKRLERDRCGVDPVLLPVGEGDDPWIRIAPLRLAEAVAKFLKRKLSIWGDEGVTASHLEGLLNGIARRREMGGGGIGRKLAVLLGGEEG